MSNTIRVRDKMQRNYTYERTARVGRDYPDDFKPELTPKEMLELGCFGGVYLRDCKNEFPKEWFTKAKFQKAGVYTPDASLNYFEVHASQPLSVWKKKGWIHKDDPRGWFQWYCRYYMGRRHEDDERQIKRWKAYKRHLAQVKKNCKKGDDTCRRKQKQSLLHWAYDARKL